MAQAWRGAYLDRERRAGGGADRGGAEVEEDGAGLTAGAFAPIGIVLFWAKRSGGRLSSPGGFIPVADGLISGVGSSETGVGGAGQLAVVALGALGFLF